MSGMDVLLGDGAGAGDLDWAADVERGGEEKWGPIRFAHEESVLVVPGVDGGSRGWLLPPVLMWKGVPKEGQGVVESRSDRVEQVMIADAKKWHDVDGDEVVKGELMEECCGYWYTFASKGGIEPHPINNVEDFGCVSGACV